METITAPIDPRGAGRVLGRCRRVGAYRQGRVYRRWQALARATLFLVFHQGMMRLHPILTPEEIPLFKLKVSRALQDLRRYHSRSS